MWFSKGTGLGVNHVRIYQGTSSDGITWNLSGTVLLESNSDATVSGSPNPDVTGIYKLIGETIADLTNDKAAFKLDGQNWYLWYDNAVSKYRISNALNGGIAGSDDSWINDEETKVDGTYSAQGTASGTITISIAWDSEKIETPMVVKVGSTYHMYYSGFKIGDGPGRYQVGHATSSDGTNWTKDSGNPVIVYHEDPNNWGYYQAAEPGVVYNPDNSTFYLYYTTAKYRGAAYDGTEFALIQGIGIATSSDGSNFTPQGVAITQSSNYPVEEKYVGYSTPFALIDSKGVFHLFYDVASYLTPSDWRQVAIAHATSSDGLTFTEVEHDIFTYDNGDWKSYEVRAPAVIEDDGLFKMWFAGNNELLFQPGFIFGIGYATRPFE